MSRAFWRRLRGAARDDVTSEVASRLLLPGTPISTIKVLLRRLGLMPGQPRERVFLRMSPTELKKFYAGVPNWLELPSGDDMRAVPLVMGVDWTANPDAAGMVQVERDETHFQLSSRLRALTEPALRKYEEFLADWDRKPLRDDFNIRVSSWEPGNRIIRLQPVSYLDSVRTNYAMDYEHAGQSLRERIHGDGRLQDLGKSLLADHLGVEVLLFSTEGHLVLGHRGRELAVTPGRLAPAGAGALKSEDVPGDHRVSLAELPLCRELFEETALNTRDIESMHILGIVRDLLRGGKPQLCLAVSCGLRSDTICTRLDAAETPEHRRLEAHDVGLGSALTECHHDLDQVRARLGELLAEHGDRMTEPLIGALALWWRSLEATTGQVAPPNPPMQPTGYAGG